MPERPNFFVARGFGFGECTRAARAARARAIFFGDAVRETVSAAPRKKITVTGHWNVPYGEGENAFWKRSEQRLLGVPVSSGRDRAH